MGREAPIMTRLRGNVLRATASGLTFVFAACVTG